RRRSTGGWRRTARRRASSVTRPGGGGSDWWGSIRGRWAGRRGAVSWRGVAVARSCLWRGGGPPASSLWGRGRRRLRHGQRLSGRGAVRRAVVHHASVGIGPGLPAGLPERVPGGVLGRPRPRLRAFRWVSGTDPLRQFEGGG